MALFLCSVGGHELWLHLDTADTRTIDDSELDVALVAPAGAPGVLDQVVVLAVVRAVSDSKDTVVNISAAIPVVVDTTLVLY